MLATEPWVVRVSLCWVTHIQYGPLTGGKINISNINKFAVTWLSHSALILVKVFNSFVTQFASSAEREINSICLIELLGRFNELIYANHLEQGLPCKCSVSISCPCHHHHHHHAVCWVLFFKGQINFKESFPVCDCSPLPLSSPHIGCPDTWNDAGFCPFKTLTYLTEFPEILVLLFQTTVYKLLLPSN